jgi:hypothetical protein
LDTLAMTQTGTAIMGDTLNHDDYDSPWKEVLERYFPAFLAFFFPAAHADIDWTHGYRFLDKELQKVVRDAELGRRWADKLLQVTTRAGIEDWLLVHIEIQERRESEFARRMFTYNYRLFDRYARPVVSLAVLGEGRKKTQGRFSYGRWGGETRFTFPTVCLNDYREREAELAASTNPFALVVQAHLQARATARNPVDRYQVKLALIKSLYQRGWERRDILELLRVIDWLLHLPADLEDRLRDEIHQIEQEAHMRYVTSFERIGIRKGMEKGMARGMEKGIEKGIEKGLESERRALLRLVRRRFGEATAEHSAPRLARITQPTLLEDLFEDLFDCADEHAWLSRLDAALGD